jgi:phosphatidylglycerol:prolipoprotein diacylglycerol transferase
MTPRLAYGLFMLLALVVFLVARHFTPKPPALEALPPWKRWLLALAGFVGGVFGAKMPFVVLYGDSWLQWFTTWLSDGKTIVVGMIGAYVSVELMKLCLGVTVKTGDTFAVPLALAMAVGRWGCFFNGCCYGTPTSLPWGVPFQVGDQVRICHPTQVYESAFHLIMAGMLLLLMRTGLLPGQRLKLYLILYGIYRFLTEFIRPEPAWWLGLTFYQWAALVLAVGLTIQWIVEALTQRNRAVVSTKAQLAHAR